MRRLEVVLVALVATSFGCGSHHRSRGAEPTYVDIEAGGRSTCALRSDGTAVCWGYAFPEPVELPGPITQVAVGANQACVLRGTSIECIGAPFISTDDPTLEVPPGEYRGVSTGLSSSCGIHTDGSVQCWGGNGPPFAPSLDPVVALRQVADMVCAVTAMQDVACWDVLRATYPVRRLPEGTYREAVPSDDWARCGITTSGDVVCDVGDCSAAGSPTAPCDDTAAHWAERVGTGPGGTFEHLTASISFFLCGLRPGGDFVCWGDDYDNGITSVLAPLRPLEPTGTRFRDLSAGDDHVCGITLEGEIACWGDNTYGQAQPPPERGGADGG